MLGPKYNVSFSHDIRLLLYSYKDTWSKYVVSMYIPLLVRCGVISATFLVVALCFFAVGTSLVAPFLTLEATTLWWLTNFILLVTSPNALLVVDISAKNVDLSALTNLSSFMSEHRNNRLKYHNHILEGTIDHMKDETSALTTNLIEVSYDFFKLGTVDSFDVNDSR